MKINETDGGTYYDVFSMQNPAFSSYLICICLLVLKIMGTILLTVFNRMKTKTYISCEDVAWMGGEVKLNETVERSRRAYKNDLETIPLFCLIGLGYLWTRPALWLINTLFVIYLASRVCHTFVYTIYVIPQPARAILWSIGIIILGYMCIHTALYAFITSYL